MNLKMKTLSISAAALALGLMASEPASAITIYYNVSSPPLNTWTNFNAPLTAGNWRVNSYTSSTFATNAQIQHVLQNLTGFFLMTEWNTGPDDTNLDNIVFGSGPSSTFTTGNEGWRLASVDPAFDIATQTLSYSAAPWDSGFGNPGGSLRAGDIYYWVHTAAPSSYLGNQLARFGETISGSIYLRYSDNVPYSMIALTAPDNPPPIPAPAALGLFGLGLLTFSCLIKRPRRT